MKNVIIGSVMVAEVALTVCIMGIYAHRNNNAGEEMMAQASQKKTVIVNDSDKGQDIDNGKNYQMIVKK